jgi:maleate isomerase
LPRTPFEEKWLMSETQTGPNGKAPTAANPGKDLEVFGSGGRIGYVAPSTCERVAKEFYQVAPADLALIIATLSIKRITQEEVDSALQQLEAAAMHLVVTGAEAVYAAGLPLVVAGGHTFDDDLRRRLEDATGLACGTDLSVALAALEELGLEDILLVTPFTQQYTEEIARVLADTGVNVLGSAGMGYDRQSQYGLLPDSAPRDAIRELLADHPGARGIYVPCGRIGDVRHISAWELEFGLPVLTANQLMIWWSLRQANAVPAIDDCGELLSRMRRLQPL